MGVGELYVTFRGYMMSQYCANTKTIYVKHINTGMATRFDPTGSSSGLILESFN
jgi:hypothetical protein